MEIVSRLVLAILVLQLNAVAAATSDVGVRWSMTDPADPTALVTLAPGERLSTAFFVVNLDEVSMTNVELRVVDTRQTTGLVVDLQETVAGEDPLHDRARWEYVPARREGMVIGIVETPAHRLDFDLRATLSYTKNDSTFVFEESFVGYVAGVSSRNTTENHARETWAPTASMVIVSSALTALIMRRSCRRTNSE